MPLKPAPEDKVIVGLDIGTTHTTLIMSQYETEVGPHSLHSGPVPSQFENARIQILGAARVSNTGMKKGTMISLEAVSSSVQECIDEVERQTGLDIESVRVGAASPGAYSDNFTESILVRNNEVKPTDVEKLTSLTKTQKAVSGMEYIHFIPGHFVVDGKSGVVDPVGMWATNLASIFHRVAFPQSDMHNIIRACNNAGVRVNGLVYEPLSAAQAVLTYDEKEIGVCCISIGASLTHVSVFAAGVPLFCKDYPVGSNHITKDLAIGLRTTQTEAERIKREAGQAFYSPTDADDILEIATMDPKVFRDISRAEVMHIVNPRVREIFATVLADLRKLKLTGFISKGLVLTGGGALLNGMCIVAEETFGTHARLGVPTEISGLVEGLKTPAAASAVGIVSPLFSSVVAHRSLNRKPSPQPNIVAKAARSLWARILEPFE